MISDKKTENEMLLVDCLLRMKKRKRAAIYTSCHCHTLSLMVEFCLLGLGAALQLPNILV